MSDFRQAVAVAAVSRAVVAATGIASVAARGDGDPNRNAHYASVIHPFSGLADTVFSALAKWDAVYYLGIAIDGYDSSERAGFVVDKTPFFPAYPLLIRATGGFASVAAAVVAAHVISLVAFGVATWLLYRLAELECRPGVARATVVLFSVFPGSLFFNAPYSESVFLAASLGCFYAARTQRWALAGVVGFVTAIARPTGILIIVPLAVLYLARNGRRLRPEAAWLVLPAVGLASFAVYLWRTVGDPLAPYRGNVGGFGRDLTIPLGALVEGVRSAYTDATTLSFDGKEELFLSSMNITLLAFAVFAIGAVIGIFRTLPAAYGAYVVAALLLPLSLPGGTQPLQSLPRFLAVLFPIFLWLGSKCESWSRMAAVTAFSVPVLVVFTAEHAHWIFIA